MCSFVIRLLCALNTLLITFEQFSHHISIAKCSVFVRHRCRRIGLFAQRLLEAQWLTAMDARDKIVDGVEVDHARR